MAISPAERAKKLDKLINELKGDNFDADKTLKSLVKDAGDLKKELKSEGD